jgi:hypothetical protein|tara:strand:+ start:15113 stop:15484 length:372 start_codon:yes stop_codon:yes gene_type:complete
MKALNDHILKVLEAHTDSQINMASRVAREQLASEIATAVEAKGATDTKILDEVYRRLTNMLEATDGNGTGRALKSFIEEEWQTADYLARFQEAGVGVQGEIGVSDGHTDGCGYDDGTEQNNPF